MSWELHLASVLTEFFRQWNTVSEEPHMATHLNWSQQFIKLVRFMVSFQRLGLITWTNLCSGTWVYMFVSLDRGLTKDKVWWGREGVRQGRPWSHNTPTANKRETKLPAQPTQTHSYHMTTLLWQRESVCVCCQWGGVVMWVSSREWNKWIEGDSLPH